MDRSKVSFVFHCLAKNDEKEMFEKLVKNATEAKNIPDNFIGSIIDDENHSLLHYLVVRGDDAGIQMVLETNSTRKTTLENKRNFTPVHFAAYLVFSPFPSNVIILSFSPSSLGMKGIRFLIFCNLVCSTFSVFLVSSLACGTKSQYEDSRHVIENLFQIKCPSTKQKKSGGRIEKKNNQQKFQLRLGNGPKKK
jgi:hypothetical protein